MSPGGLVNPERSTMYTIDTFEREGWKSELYSDDEPMSPDQWDNLATFKHSTDYTFGESCNEPERGWNVYIRALGIFGHDVATTLPVRVVDYGSSGMTIHESDAEDANGVLYTTHARLNDLCGEDDKYHSREWATTALREELAVWRQYLEGDVYGYVVTDPAGEQADSLWSLYGYEYAKAQAEQALGDSIAYEHKQTEAISRICAI